MDPYENQAQEIREKVGRVTILLADDHEAFRAHVVQMLAPRYEVVGAVGDGAALVEAAASLHPDVLVVDISMPVLNGIEAVTRLKRSGSKAKVVFLTINQDPAFVEACFAAGATGYVLKTHLVSDLIRAITEVLAGRRFVSHLSHPATQ